jgi:hypothetical protein
VPSLPPDEQAELAALTVLVDDTLWSGKIEKNYHDTPDVESKTMLSIDLFLGVAGSTHRCSPTGD